MPTTAAPNNQPVHHDASSLSVRQFLAIVNEQPVPGYPNFNPEQVPLHGEFRTLIRAIAEDAGQHQEAGTVPAPGGKPYCEFFGRREEVLTRRIDRATLPATEATAELLTLELASVVRNYLLGPDYEAWRWLRLCACGVYFIAPDNRQTACRPECRGSAQLSNVRLGARWHPDHRRNG